MTQTSPIEPARRGFVTCGAAALLSGLLTAGLLAPSAAEACPEQEAPCPAEQAAEATDAAQPGAPVAAASQRAVIDPETGELVVPGPDDAAEAAPAAAGNAAAATSGDSGSQARQMAVPGAGIVAPFPLERVNRAVAEIDDEGKASGGCKEGVE